MSDQLTLSLDQIADEIHRVWAETKAHQVGAWEGYFRTGQLLIAARSRCRTDNEYGAWFRAQGFPFTSTQWGARLMSLARQEVGARKLVETGVSTAVNKILRQLREERPPAPSILPLLPPSMDLRLGDFRDVLADIPDGSIDLVLTDPPYAGEFLPLWSDLGAFAARVLKSGGALAAMSGQAYLPEVFRRLGDHLPYRWTAAYLLTAGSHPFVPFRQVTVGWKPIVIYGGGPHIYDVVKGSSGADKTHHDWGQSESGMVSLIRLMADPGQLVCDPFAGGGTTAVAALAHGCSFIGAEIDPETHGRAVARIAA